MGIFIAPLIAATSFYRVFILTGGDGSKIAMRHAQKSKWCNPRSF